MNTKAVGYKWLVAVVSQFIEGACDSFLIIAGGSTITQASAPTSIKGLSFHEIMVSVVIGGLIYAASYLKSNPLPGSVANPPAAPASPVANPPSAS